MNDLIRVLEESAETFDIPVHVAFMFAKLALNEARFGIGAKESEQSIKEREAYLTRCREHKQQTETLMEQWQ